VDFSLALSHHTGSGLSRCFRVGGIHLCARCSGLWPALLVGIAAQRIWPWRVSRFDVAVELALILPGLWDYARSHRRPWLGTNPGRASTGVLLGLGLSRAAVLGRVAGYTSIGFLFPILLCLCWVVLAPALWPEEPPAASS
jgi:hypothetical protein